MPDESIEQLRIFYGVIDVYASAACEMKLKHGKTWKACSKPAVATAPSCKTGKTHYICQECLELRLVLSRKFHCPDCDENRHYKRKVRKAG